MTELYFMRYMDQVSEAMDDGPLGLVDDAELIRGIEDIGGVERAEIARAVPREAALLARLMQEDGVSPDGILELSADIPVAGGPKDGGEKLVAGWRLFGDLGSAPYMTADGGVHKQTGAKVLLTEAGQMYAYRQQFLDSTGRLAIDGVALNRYSPACSTSMNDRSMLHSFAVLAAAHPALKLPA